MLSLILQLFQKDLIVLGQILSTSLLESIGINTTIGNEFRHRLNRYTNSGEEAMEHQVVPDWFAVDCSNAFLDCSSCCVHQILLVQIQVVQFSAFPHSTFPPDISDQFSIYLWPPLNIRYQSLSKVQIFSISNWH